MPHVTYLTLGRNRRLAGRLSDRLSVLVIIHKTNPFKIIGELAEVAGYIGMRDEQRSARRFLDSPSALFSKHERNPLRIIRELAEVAGYIGMRDERLAKGYVRCADYRKVA
ncbi:MAG: hypothetical protein KJ718_05180 [Nanoarchaeota archaeon]|nr:hypothetical protein [Nanoarchaeota archaeon]MBU1051919.1 hypothetical protein [Nanoarchaeota archaeon]MBU1988727.1 hypothetical protein [Nanoarchaeota archaeon]